MQVIDSNKKNTDASAARRENTNEIQWSNDDNDLFYAHIKAEGLKLFAEKAGLDDNCDLKQISPYINNAKSVLEVGAGYGRVIDYLINSNFAGKVTAIERNNFLYNYLFCLYKNKVNLIHTDILNYDEKSEKFDLILFLWSEIAGFPKHNQAQVISQLTALLAKNGKLVLDIISDETKPLLADRLNHETYTMNFESSRVYVCEPNEIEIRNYAALNKLSCQKKISYVTKTNRERWMFILS